MGKLVEFEDVLADIELRDERDASRSVAPLRPAQDAYLLDTSELDIPATMERLREILKNRLNP
jgi:cytidylate kinase